MTKRAERGYSKRKKREIDVWGVEMTIRGGGGPKRYKETFYMDK